MQIVPFRVHSDWRAQLYFQRIDHVNFEILILENDPLVKSWKHAISIKPLGQDRSIYRDVIDIDAGRLTALVWAWADLVLPASPTPLARARKVPVNIIMRLKTRVSGDGLNSREMERLLGLAQPLCRGPPRKQSSNRCRVARAVHSRGPTPSQHSPCRQMR